MKDDWRSYGIAPPSTAVAELTLRDKDPNVHSFAVVASDLQKQTQLLLHSHGPFLVKAFRDAQPKASMDDVIFASLQPIVCTVFAEWVKLYQHKISGGTNDPKLAPRVDMKHAMTEFSQFCCDSVMAMAGQMLRAQQTPNSGKSRTLQ